MRAFNNGTFRVQTVVMAALMLACVSGCNKETSDEAIGRGQRALIDGDYKQAVYHLSRAAKLNPENDIVLYNLGMAQLLGKDYKGAVRSFDASDKLNRETDPDALEALAHARREMGDYDGAIRAFERAFSKVNRKAYLVAGMAVCEMDQGHNEYAKQLLLEALATDANDPIALFNMAALMQKPQFGEPQKAAGFYIQFLVKSRKDDFPVQRTTAVSQISAISANRPPELQMKIDDKIMAAKTARKPATARDLATEAVLMDQSNPDSLWMLMEALKSAGDVNNAAIIRSRFNTIFPNDPRAQVN